MQITQSLKCICNPQIKIYDISLQSFMDMHRMSKILSFPQCSSPAEMEKAVLCMLVSASCRSKTTSHYGATQNRAESSALGPGWWGLNPNLVPISEAASNKSLTLPNLLLCFEEGGWKEEGELPCKRGDHSGEGGRQEGQ